jgi:hypothetical protein
MPRPPAATGSQQSSRTARSASPVKRKKSVARSPSPRLRADVDAGKLQRSLSTLEKKPPLAPPSQASTLTGTSDSSPAVSCDPSPRPASPVPVPTTQRFDKQDKERVRVFVRMRPMRPGEGESTVRLDVRRAAEPNARIGRRRTHARPTRPHLARRTAHLCCAFGRSLGVLAGGRSAAVGGRRAAERRHRSVGAAAVRL